MTVDEILEKKGAELAESIVLWYETSVKDEDTLKQELMKNIVDAGSLLKEAEEIRGNSQVVCKLKEAVDLYDKTRYILGLIREADTTNRSFYDTALLPSITELLADINKRIASLNQFIPKEYTEEEKLKELQSTYFGKSAEHYITHYWKIKDTSTLSFNGWALFFNSYWFIYRKMYVEGIVMYIVMRCISDLFPSIILTLLFFLSFGLLSNFYYVQKMEKQVNSAISTYEDHDDRIFALERQGGTNFKALMIMLVVTFIIEVILRAIK